MNENLLINARVAAAKLRFDVLCTKISDAELGITCTDFLQVQGYVVNQLGNLRSIGTMESVGSK